MLNQLSRTRETIFSTNIASLRTTFTKTRKITAKKLQNERILRIPFHTFRHWKGTMEYHKTKDIVHAKQVLGHKSINNTMIYINIEQALFLTENDEWTCKTASNPKQVTELIEADSNTSPNLTDSNSSKNANNPPFFFVPSKIVFSETFLIHTG